METGGRRGKGIESGKERREGKWKVAFWNVVGVRNKDKDFWEGLEEWDIMLMIETWIDEWGWEKIRRRLPIGYKWSAQMAKRKYEKGRPSGGMMLGIREEIEVEEVEREETEGRMSCLIRMGDERWKIIGLYVNGDMEKKLEGLKNYIEEREKGAKILIGGDFNAGTEELGGKTEEGGQEEEEEKRKSRDKKVNKEGKRLVDFIEGRGWMILNGTIKGDEGENIRIREGEEKQ